MIHETVDIPALMMGLEYITAHILKTLPFPVELVSICKGYPEYYYRSHQDYNYSG